MGYPTQLVDVLPGEEARRREERDLLKRLGVAVAGMGALMFPAVSEYAGMDGALKHTFHWVSMLLFLPVLFYSAGPFFSRAWGSLRTGALSIDFPIAFGLLAGTLTSLASLIKPQASGPLGGVFFDSLSMLVAMLLGGRYLLKRIQNRAISRASLLRNLLPAHARTSEGWKATAALKFGEEIEVQTQEMFPVDGILKTSAWIDSKLFTGESQPVERVVGQGVFAGEVLHSGTALVETRAANLKSRIGSWMEKISDSQSKSLRLGDMADRASVYFVMGVLALVAVAAWVGFEQGGLEESLSRGLAMAIVACPCALALVTPLAISSFAGNLAKGHTLLLKPEVLEKLGRVRRIFFDKTGTLTFGRPHVTSMELTPEGESFGQKELLEKAYQLERLHRHPLARAICEYAQERLEQIPLQNFDSRTEGFGVEGRDESGLLWRLGARDQDPAVLTRSGIVLARFHFSDVLRPGAREALQAFQARGIRVTLLTGDRKLRAGAISEELGGVEVHAELSPEEKACYVSESYKRGENPLMMGDGLNDALALSEAYVAVAVESGLELCMVSSHLYQSRVEPREWEKWFELARTQVRSVVGAFMVSGITNLFSATLAVFGWITPMAAAVLMPITAILVTSMVFIQGGRRT
jgi:Cu2+-exporting ATPase